MFARSASDQAMWAAIMADPENDAPRLVYADALQQRGEPLGELIALQCHPEFRGDRRLRERSNALYLANIERWTEEVGVMGAHLSFERGLPHLVGVPFGPDALSIVDRVPVRWVRLHGGSDASALEVTRSIARDPRLARVFTINTWGDSECARLLIESPHFAARRLIVESGSCTNAVAQTLASTPLPHLRKLTLSGNRSSLNDEGLAALARSPQLQLHTLEFSHLELTARAMEHLAGTTLPLRELSLTFAGDVNAGMQVFAPSPACARLERLSLVSGRVDDRTFAALVTSKSALRVLEVQINRITSAGLDALTSGELQLESLSIGHNEISAASVTAFVTSTRFANLRHFAMPAVAKGAEPALALARSGSTAQLRELDLSNCRGRDEAAFALARSESLRGLERLTFLRNKVTHAGRKAMQDRFGDRLSID